MDDPTFGPAFDARIDGKRIEDQFSRIRTYMLRAGELQDWRTLAEIAMSLGFPEASISAQLRHMRKKRFGSYRVNKRRRRFEMGTWEYQVLPPQEILQLIGE